MNVKSLLLMDLLGHIELIMVIAWKLEFYDFKIFMMFFTSKTIKNSKKKFGG